MRYVIAALLSLSPFFLFAAASGTIFRLMRGDWPTNPYDTADVVAVATVLFGITLFLASWGGLIYLIGRQL